MVFRFLEQEVDAFVRMQLLDLARTLARRPQVRIDFDLSSYFDPESQTIYISQFWDELDDPKMQLEGMKSDVYIRSMEIKASDRSAIARYMSRAAASARPKLATQLFIMAEELRLSLAMMAERPGTQRVFDVRRQVYTRYFARRLPGHVRRGEQGDALFTALYLWLTANEVDPRVPGISAELYQLLKQLQPQLEWLMDASSTAEVAERCWGIVEALDVHLAGDMQTTYWAWPKSRVPEPEPQVDIDPLKRASLLKAYDEEGEQKVKEDQRKDQKLPMWHQDTADKTDHFLQFELEEGARSTALGGVLRQSDSGDQAVGMVQGSAHRSSRDDYEDPQTVLKRLETLADEQKALMGDINRHVKPVFVPPKPASQADRTAYEELIRHISPFKRKLMKTIQLILEHKHTAAREFLPFGRLTRKLTRLLTEDSPRLFYKKKNPSRQIDAAFMLLVDCSASMYDKMTETQRGIALFHECLRGLSIPHMVTGFWEESGEGKSGTYPNYFQPVIEFSRSLLPDSGPAIMQLKPQQDNRDGYAIRLMSAHLLERTEARRFLLVFSDGEPAAQNYEAEGILDTYQAVLEARRKGIDVIGIYLAGEQVPEKVQQTFRNIYGRHSIVVPHVNELNDHLLPILRKLLLKAMV
ncbi:von Willebrand factor type A [Caldalkalibacillus thermarum TA2.A1]|uniref:VWA domain-containing protein n=1 Tax=Caldalkalibacillus thermarum (strain TA2.A1) TaxID=986075 RepID=F5L899_CALTT|nr:VWA domain-containing protein [Caldalkalibacillus thermarum]EGL82419.1 von Willebrand factor type A [Caldalkalibacillus thermarum TA2.A1]QZT35009.1 VWA domain-containing protein [Caldalkalibacillus thermarum TA2.A1]